MNLVAGKIEAKYGEGWDDYIFSEDHPDNVFWKQTLNTAQDKLNRRPQPTKGLGKGKTKGIAEK